MTKRIILTTLIVLLSGGLLGSYFHFIGREVAKGRQQARCREVRVVLLDSLESHIVDAGQIRRSLAGQTIGKPIDSIDLHQMETQLRSLGEVMRAEVFAADDRTLAVTITQRKPVIRFERGAERWYADPEGYLFPVRNAVDVPIVTGNLPLQLDAAYKGFAPEQKTREWTRGMVDLALYIDSNPVLKREIAQLDIAANGDIVLYTRQSGPAIIFGDSGDLETKFRKLEAWWCNIEPQLEKGKHYKTINLKYNQQIICTQL